MTLPSESTAVLVVTGSDVAGASTGFDAMVADFGFARVLDDPGGDLGDGEP
jgi:hypothetical protein